MNFDRTKINRITQGFEPFRKIALRHHSAWFPAEFQQESEFPRREIKHSPCESRHIAPGFDLQLADRPDFGSLLR